MLGSMATKVPAASRVPAAGKAAAAGKVPVARPRSDDPVVCSVFDQMRGRPCGEPAETESLTCKVHRVRPTRTQLSRIDAARKRYG